MLPPGPGAPALSRGMHAESAHGVRFITTRRRGVPPRCGSLWGDPVRMGGGGGAAGVDARVWRPPGCGAEAPPPVVSGSRHRTPLTTGGRVDGGSTGGTGGRGPGTSGGPGVWPCQAGLAPLGGRSHRVPRAVGGRSHRVPRAVGGWPGSPMPTGRAPGSAEAHPRAPHSAWPDGRLSGVRRTAVHVPGRAGPQRHAVGGSRRRTAAPQGAGVSRTGGPTTRPGGVTAPGGRRPTSRASSHAWPASQERRRTCPRRTGFGPPPHATRAARNRCRRPVRTGSRTSWTVGRSG